MSSAAIVMTSPQRADPLTWIIGFNLPLAAAITGAAGGVAVAAIVAPAGAHTGFILGATALVVAACLIVVLAGRPREPFVRPVQAVPPVLLGLASITISALAHRGSTVEVGHWSGPIGYCLVLLALVPYSSALMTAAYGLAGAVASGIFAQWAFPDPDAPPLGILIAGATLPFNVGIAGACFTAMVVAAVTRWRALPYDREERSDSAAAFASRLREHGTPMAIGDDVTGLLRRAAETGRITAKDRSDAAALAEGIRADLVRAADRSWLEAIPQHRQLIVEDPENAANRMTREQRATIHALIVGALESPVVADEVLRIELRPLDDGTTAVALSMNITLPEGRRVMMLAPYFVSLKASVDDFEWAGGEQLRMRFKLPPPESGPRV